jgi:hypothetical protein
MLASAIVAPVTTISSGAGQRQEFRRNRAPPLPQRMHQAALLPSVEIRFRGLHTGGFKAFAEAIVNRLQKATCLGGPAHGDRPGAGLMLCLEFDPTLSTGLHY